MVGEIPEIRRAERQGRGRRSVSFSRVARADARPDGRRRLSGLSQEKRGQLAAAGERLRQEGRGRLEAHLTEKLSVIGSPFTVGKPNRELRTVNRELRYRDTTNAAVTSTAVSPASITRARSLSFALP